MNKEVQRKQQPLNLLNYFQEIMLVCSSRIYIERNFSFHVTKEIRKL